MRLYIVATPIGNLDDISLRALETLRKVDLIAAEDTRHSIKLLNHFAIKTKMMAYHDHNEVQASEKLIDHLKKGQTIALISDAGMPLISDPGSVLIKACVQAGIPMEVIPGASAGISALALSGLDTRRFLFLGFLDKDSKTYQEGIEAIRKSPYTLVLYESPHRLKKTLANLEKAGLGHRQVSVSRELTKRYEETRHGTISQQVLYYVDNQPRGEFVLCIEGQTKAEQVAGQNEKTKNISLEEQFDFYVKEGMAEKEAMRQVAKERGLSRRDVYNQVKR